MHFRLIQTRFTQLITTAKGNHSSKMAVSVLEALQICPSLFFPSKRFMWKAQGCFPLLFGNKLHVWQINSCKFSKLSLLGFCRINLSSFLLLPCSHGSDPHSWLLSSTPFAISVCIPQMITPLYVVNQIVLIHCSKPSSGTSLVVQWVRLRAPNAGGPGWIPGRGTRSHMRATTKSLRATTKSLRATTKKPACYN